MSYRDVKIASIAGALLEHPKRIESIEGADLPQLANEFDRHDGGAPFAEKVRRYVATTPTVPARVQIERRGAKLHFYSLEGIG